MEQPNAGTAVSLRRRDSLSADCVFSAPLHPYKYECIRVALHRSCNKLSKSPDNTLLRCWSKLVACTMHVMQHITYLHAW